MNFETIVLDELIDPAVYEYFLNRPRKLKFDEYNGKWYHIKWSDNALKERTLRTKALYRQKYKEVHPIKEKTELSWYLKHKMGLPANPVGRPKKNMNESEDKKINEKN